MPAIQFKHEQVGTLVIDNGLDDAAWGYNLNTANFPTYGGEVVQILSVYIDDLTLMGSCATYKQMEAIYEFFASYLQIATQGKNPNPNIADSIGGSAYNLYPVYFSYPERGWFFKLYPKNVPGFRYGRDVVIPTWQISSHVVDDSPDLALIKDGIKALETQKLIDGETLGINGTISPKYGNPDTDPFQTYDASLAPQTEVIKKYSDYYNSLIGSYSQDDFSALTGAIGSKPNLGQTSPNTTPSTVNLPKPTAAPKPGKGSAPAPAKPSTGGSKHNADYQILFRTWFNTYYHAYKTGGCAAVRASIFRPNAHSDQAMKDAWNSFKRAPYNCSL